MKKRYELQELFTSTQLGDAVTSELSGLTALNFGLSFDATMVSFIVLALYNHFYEDIVGYYSKEENDTDAKDEIKAVFVNRLSYDIAVKFAYWKRKYDYIKKLLTGNDYNLLQTSRMISSSSENVSNAGGVLQKSASTPTGVATGSTTTDSIDVTISGNDTATSTNDIDTDGYVEKYTNYEGKTATANKMLGERSGDVLREGSITDLINVLEKLPASFTNEITSYLAKHFMFVYEY